MSEFLGLPPEAICPVCGAEVRHHDHEMLYHHAVEIYAKLYARQKVRIAELEGKLREAEAVQAEAAEMAESALSVLDGDGELSLVGGYLGDIAALSGSPSAQALTRLVEAALHLSRQRRAGLEHTAVFGDIKMADLEILDHYVDAYLAARTGRGEGE